MGRAEDGSTHSSCIPPDSRTFSILSTSYPHPSIRQLSPTYKSDAFCTHELSSRSHNRDRRAQHQYTRPRIHLRILLPILPFPLLQLLRRVVPQRQRIVLPRRVMYEYPRCNIHDQQNNSDAARHAQELIAGRVCEQSAGVDGAGGGDGDGLGAPVERGEEGGGEEERKDPDGEEGVVELGGVRVEVLFPDLGAAGEEGRARDEQEVEDNHADDCGLQQAQSTRVREWCHIWGIACGNVRTRI